MRNFIANRVTAWAVSAALVMTSAAVPLPAQQLIGARPVGTFLETNRSGTISKQFAAENQTFMLPAELGMIQSSRPGTGPTLFHIETAHGNYDAQASIRQILNYLKREQGVSTVFLEGAADELRPEILRLFPRRSDLTLRVMERLTRQGLLKGADLFLVENTGTNGVGIESLPLYLKNKEAFRKTLEEREKARPFLRALETRLNNLSAAYLNRDLRTFLRNRQDHEAGILTLDQWLSFLTDFANEHLGLDLQDRAQQIDWPMLSRLARLKAMEREIDRGALQSETESFLKQTEPYYSPDREAFSRLKDFLYSRGGKIDAAESAEPVVRNLVDRLPVEFSYSAFPELTRFFRARLLSREMDGRLLMGELRELEKQIMTRMAQTEREKKMTDFILRFSLVQKLFMLTLNAEELAALESYGRTLDEWLAELNSLDADQSLPRDALNGLLMPYALYDSAFDFYKYARGRDEALARNVRREMLKRGLDKAAVVTGGFHSLPLEEKFTDEGYRYYRISPAIETIDQEKDYAVYLRGMLQKDSEKFSYSTLESHSPLVYPEDLVRIGADPSFERDTVVKEAARELAAAGLDIRPLNRSLHARVFDYLVLPGTSSSGGPRLVLRSDLRDEQQKNLILNGKGALTIALSLGGTKVAAALVDEFGNIWEPEPAVNWREAFTLNAETGSAKPLVDAIAKTVLKTLSLVPASRVTSVGLSLPGPVRYSEEGTAIAGYGYKLSNLPFKDFSITDALWESLSLFTEDTEYESWAETVKVRVLQDGHAAAFGELGPGGTFSGRDNVTALIFGTGLGAGVVRNGALYEGVAIDEGGAEDGKVRDLGGLGRHLVYVPDKLTERGYHYEYRNIERGKGQPAVNREQKEALAKERLGGPALAVLIAGDVLRVEDASERSAILKAMGLNEKDLKEFAQKDSAERSVDQEKNILTGFNRAAGTGNAWAVNKLKDIGVEIGTVIGTFIAAFRDEPFVENIVLVSSIAENLGAGVKEKSSPDIFLEHIRTGLITAVAGLTNMAASDAERFARGVFRSKINYRREFLAFSPNASEDALEAAPVFSDEEIQEAYEIATDGSRIIDPDAEYPTLSMFAENLPTIQAVSMADAEVIADQYSERHPDAPLIFGGKKKRIKKSSTAKTPAKKKQMPVITPKVIAPNTADKLPSQQEEPAPISETAEEPKEGSPEPALPVPAQEAETPPAPAQPEAEDMMLPEETMSPAPAEGQVEPLKTPAERANEPEAAGAWSSPQPLSNEERQTLPAVDWEGRTNKAEKIEVIETAVALLQKKNGRKWIPLSVLAESIGRPQARVSTFISRTSGKTYQEFFLIPEALTKTETFKSVLLRVSEDMRKSPHEVLLREDVAAYMGRSEAGLFTTAKSVASEENPAVVLGRDFGIFSKYDSEETHAVRREWARKNLIALQLPETEENIESLMKVTAHGEHLAVKTPALSEVRAFHETYADENDGRTPTLQEAAEHFKISRPTMSKIYKAFQNAGHELGSRRPQSLSAEERKQIQALLVSGEAAANDGDRDFVVRFREALEYIRERKELYGSRVTASEIGRRLRASAQVYQQKQADEVTANAVRQLNSELSAFRRGADDEEGSERRSDLRGEEKADNRRGPNSSWRYMIGQSLVRRAEGFFIHKPDYSIYEDGVLEKKTEPLSPDHYVVRMVDSAIEYLRETAESANNLDLLARYDGLKNTTTLIAKELPTHFFFDDSGTGVPDSTRISFRVRTIYLSKRFIEILNPADEADRAILAFYLNRSQFLLDQFHRLLELGYSSDEIYSELRAEIESPDFKDRKLLLKNVPQETLAEIFEPLLKEDRRLRKLDAQMIDQKAKETIERAKEMDRLVVSLRAVPEEEAVKTLPDRVEIAGMAHELEGLAAEYQSLGRMALARQIYDRALVMYRHVQEVDPKAFYPYQVQEEIVRFLLRAGMLDEFVTALRSLLTGKGFPEPLLASDRDAMVGSLNDAAHIQIPVWVFRHGPQFLYALEVYAAIYEADETKAWVRDIQEETKEILQMYWKTYADEKIREGFNFDTPISRFAHKEEDRVELPVYNAIKKIKIGWKITETDGVYKVRIEAFDWAAEKEFYGLMGRFEFSFTQGGDAIARDKDLVVPSDYTESYKGLSRTLVIVGLRIARANGAAAFEYSAEGAEKLPLPLSKTGFRKKGSVWRYGNLQKKHRYDLPVMRIEAPERIARSDLRDEQSLDFEDGRGRVLFETFRDSFLPPAYIESLGVQNSLELLSRLLGREVFSVRFGFEPEPVHAILAEYGDGYLGDARGFETWPTDSRLIPGRLVLDGVWLDRLLERPRALYLLLKHLNAIQLQTGTREPLLAVEGTKEVYDDMKKALLRRNDWQWEEEVEARNVLLPELSRLVKVLEIAPGEKSESWKPYLRENGYGVAALLSDANSGQSIPGRANFILEPGRLDSKDVDAAAYALIDMLKAASLIRDLGEGEARDVLGRFLAVHFPGTSVSAAGYQLNLRDYVRELFDQQIVEIMA